VEACGLSAESSNDSAVLTKFSVQTRRGGEAEGQADRQADGQPLLHPCQKCGTGGTLKASSCS
jgi:hypothetical protein